ncbi:PH domain-containing protein [Qipengyuania atrilutea]|uniref:PH domain-containing protein n=1 Tax=Qipengyuania atrilutea TaxID=2744473 RepID=A0A850H4N2_9SPHN|nr:PH domain-containing protein [Actirhodobacter atriluteus]NVD45142.1 PH domain-containing protein [Actirhodobacter atriluteus]
MEERALSSEHDDDGALTPLHPDHIKVLRINALLMLLPVLAGVIVLEIADFAPAGLFAGLYLLVAIFILWRIPRRRYRFKGFAMSGDRLRVVRGLWWHSDTVVPFGRVQHIDVDQGPVQRYYKLATLTLHTAGTHNASVHLPGLLHEEALAMREEIRAHIKRETL